jgi:hypothetical protein
LREENDAGVVSSTDSRRDFLVKTAASALAMVISAEARKSFAAVDTMPSNSASKETVVSPASKPASAEQVEKLSGSRIYDATVLGEPIAVGKDKARVWQKILSARVVYLGEAESVPDPDDKVRDLYGIAIGIDSRQT